jgi:hypothetical protein
MSPAPPTHPSLRPRRIGIAAGSQVSAPVGSLCAALGRELVGEDGLTVVTGGLKHLAVRPDRPAGEWVLIQEALRRVEADGIDPEARIETLLVEADSADFVRFRAGAVRVMRNRSRQARRFALVHAADALLAIAGQVGVTQMVDLALALEKPCLPLPCSGGASRERWQENRDLIVSWFGLSPAEVTRLEETRLDELTPPQFADLAALVKQILLRRLRRKCFVMMPFAGEYDGLYAQALRPGIEAAGFNPVRADHLNLVGDAIEVLRTAIHACDGVVAVLTGFNVNVMYELGFAHALGKPVVLLCAWGAGRKLPELPFDLRSENVLGYGDDFAAVRERLVALLAQVRA